MTTRQRTEDASKAGMRLLYQPRTQSWASRRMVFAGLPIDVSHMRRGLRGIRKSLHVKSRTGSASLLRTSRFQCTVDSNIAQKLTAEYPCIHDELGNAEAHSPTEHQYLPKGTHTMVLQRSQEKCTKYPHLLPKWQLELPYLEVSLVTGLNKRWGQHLHNLSARK